MDLMSTAQIVEHLAKLGLVVEPQTIRRWEERHDDFPRSFKPGRDLLWPGDAIVQWCKDTGRLQITVPKREAQRLMRESMKQNSEALRKLKDC